MKPNKIIGWKPSEKAENTTKMGGNIIVGWSAVGKLKGVDFKDRKQFISISNKIARPMEKSWWSTTFIFKVFPHNLEIFVKNSNNQLFGFLFKSLTKKKYFFTNLVKTYYFMCQTHYIFYLKYFFSPYFNSIINIQSKIHPSK